MIPPAVPKINHADGTRVKKRADTAFMPGGNGGGPSEEGIGKKNGLSDYRNSYISILVWPEPGLELCFSSLLCVSCECEAVKQANTADGFQLTRAADG